MPRLEDFKPDDLKGITRITEKGSHKGVRMNFSEGGLLAKVLQVMGTSIPRPRLHIPMPPGSQAEQSTERR